MNSFKDLWESRNNETLSDATYEKLDNIYLDLVGYGWNPKDALQIIEELMIIFKCEFA